MPWWLNGESTTRPGNGGSIERSGRTIGQLVKVGEAIRLLEEDGWSQVRQKGDHRQFRHPFKPGTTTVAGKLSADLKKGTWASIRRQAGLKGQK